ncbi:MAG TPA: hypothetical protein VNA16_00605, partial [Abditibacteriaceae bacterium]|nr:hypothetical protein [Abditibacteriaceae bacterium]
KKKVQRSIWPHNDTMPILFADGHAKAQSRTLMRKWNCTAPKILTNWNGTPSTATNACGYWNPTVPAPN